MDQQESCQDCPTVITLKETVRQMERDNEQRDKDLKSLLAFQSKMEMLLTLSVGGGALSLVSTLLAIITLVTVIQTGKP